MSAELVEEALKLPKYRQQIEDAEIQIPVKEDTREYAPQPQLRREVKALSKAEREGGKMTSLVDGLKKGKEGEEELEDLIPVETESKELGLDSLTSDELQKLRSLLAKQ